MRITTKFGSLELDFYNSTYDFSKLTYISEINELASRPKPLTVGVPESAGPTCHRLKNRVPALTGQSLPTASSPVTAPALRASPRHPARTSVASWTDCWS